VESGTSLPGAADVQAVHNLNLELSEEREKVILSRKGGRTNWKKRARSQVLLRDEVNLVDEESSSSFSSSRGFEDFGHAKKAKNGSAVAVEQPCRLQ
jgi:hypothetical protein